MKVKVVGNTRHKNTIRYTVSGLSGRHGEACRFSVYIHLHESLTLHDYTNTLLNVLMRIDARLSSYINNRYTHC